MVSNGIILQNKVSVRWERKGGKCEDRLEEYTKVCMGSSIRKCFMSKESEEREESKMLCGGHSWMERCSLCTSQDPALNTC